MISQANFVGKYQVAVNNFTQLTPYITRYEPKLINELFGAELAIDFNDDPEDEIWDDLKAIGFGLESLLTGMVYFQYVRDLPFRVTNMGVVYNLDENSTNVMPALILRQRYNECVNDWNEMAKYLKENFEKYKGVKKKYITD
jgi:hypothetical protein